MLSSRKLILLDDGPVTLNRTGPGQRTSPYGEVTSLRHIWETDTHERMYLQRIWTGCHEQERLHKMGHSQFNQPYVTE